MKGERLLDISDLLGPVSFSQQIARAGWQRDLSSIVRLNIDVSHMNLRDSCLLHAFGRAVRNLDTLSVSFLRILGDSEMDVRAAKAMTRQVAESCLINCSRLEDFTWTVPVHIADITSLIRRFSGRLRRLHIVAGGSHFKVDTEPAVIWENLRSITIVYDASGTHLGLLHCNTALMMAKDRYPRLRTASIASKTFVPYYPVLVRHLAKQVEDLRLLTADEDVTIPISGAPSLRSVSLCLEAVYFALCVSDNMVETVHVFCGFNNSLPADEEKMDEVTEMLVELGEATTLAALTSVHLHQFQVNAFPLNHEFHSSPYLRFQTAVRELNRLSVVVIVGEKDRGYFSAL